MCTNEINVKKICSFYVSDWHLTAMLLPYITNKAQKDENIKTILNKNIKSNMIELLSRINIEEKTKDKIAKINWENNYKDTYEEINNYMKEQIDGKEKTTIILVGTKTEIENMNKNIDKWIINNIVMLNNKKVNIINCYNVEEFNSNMKEILDEHDYMLNTSGEHEISEMFEGYSKKSVS